MILKMLVTSVKPQKHMDGHLVMEEIELRSVEGFKPTSNIRIRLTDPQGFGTFDLHQKVSIQVQGGKDA